MSTESGLALNVSLDNADYLKAMKFAMMLWDSGKLKSDWRDTDIVRELGKYLIDHTIGKLGEIAFARFMEEEFGWKVKLDFILHPGLYTTDSTDIAGMEKDGKEVMPCIKIDIKSTKVNSVWAMVEQCEFHRRKYDAYIWIKVDFPLDRLAAHIFDAIKNGSLNDIESILPQPDMMSAEVMGIAWLEEVEKWKVFPKGEWVTSPSSERRLFRAKTDNIGSPLCNLHKGPEDWKTLIAKLVQPDKQ